jgi:hypothetical protein
MPGPGGQEKRRAAGAIRVPFVRRCRIEYEGVDPADGFLVNINVLGAYVAHDTMPPLGRTVTCHFQPPGSEREVVVEGVVAWTNPRQEHPVHSLPPGFGMAFRSVDEETRGRIEKIVFDYLARQSSGGS